MWRLAYLLSESPTWLAIFSSLRGSRGQNLVSRLTGNGEPYRWRDARVTREWIANEENVKASTMGKIRIASNRILDVEARLQPGCRGMRHPAQHSVSLTYLSCGVCGPAATRAPAGRAATGGVGDVK